MAANRHSRFLPYTLGTWRSVVEILPQLTARESFCDTIHSLRNCAMQIQQQALMSKRGQSCQPASVDRASVGRQGRLDASPSRGARKCSHARTRAYARTHACA
eukprot:1856240-Pleurochrysis_carterae.AAC.1